MIDFSSVEDILKFAIAKEEAAYQFYMDMADRMESETSSELFEQLAQEEFNHKAQLELEMMKLGEVIPAAEPESERNKDDYMLDGDFPKDMSYKDVLLMAIKKEKASFKLYVELARMVKDEESVETFMTLAEEEARHKTLFEIEYNKLTQRKH